MIILDASFLVKLVLDEEGSDIAEKLLREWIISGEDIVSIDIALSESLNALWKHYALIKDLDLVALNEALKDLLTIWNKLSIIPTAEIADKALDLSVKYNIAIYDSLYLAIAQHYKAAIATFDRRQREIALELGLKTHP
ncbi:MAG: hypothetical protein DRO40_08380 [Thermoprotei archaeon]|nr:MAG: hypothetical protein DRO40_08380 [Thermoprotei archaeon]